MSSLPRNNRRRRKPRKPTKRGPPLRSQAGKYPPLPSFFDAFPSFTRDPSRTPEQDFRLLQEQQDWELSSPLYAEFRRKFLAALATETGSQVHAFFVNHEDFLEYNCTASPHNEFSRLEQLLDHPPDRTAFEAAFRVEFCSPLDLFFRRYPDFQYNPRGAPMGEFRRLVLHRKWNPERAKQEEYGDEPETKAYSTARTSFFDAFREEFDGIFGTDAEAFSTWQKLCETLGVEPIPESVTQCRKVTRPLMVNIYDITHHERTGAPFDFFNNLRDLRSYTIEEELFFPKKRAKESALKLLLRHIFPGSRRK